MGRCRWPGTISNRLQDTHYDVPVNETLVVEPDSGTTVQAVHRVELLGVRLFELSYRIRQVTGSADP